VRGCGWKKYVRPIEFGNVIGNAIGASLTTSPTEQQLQSDEDRRDAAMSEALGGNSPSQGQQAAMAAGLGPVSSGLGNAYAQASAAQAAAIEVVARNRANTGLEFDAIGQTSTRSLADDPTFQGSATSNNGYNDPERGFVPYQSSNYPYALPFSPTPFTMNNGPRSSDGQVYMAFDRVGNGGYSIPGPDGIYREVGLQQGDRFTFRNILDQATTPESRFALTAYSCYQWGAGCREFAELGTQFYPADQRYQYALNRMDGMGTDLVNFEKASVLGALGMVTGGWAFGAMRGMGIGALGSGATAGVVGDLTMQAGDNGLFLATGGKYGRSGIDGTELALSGFLGAAPALPSAIRQTAADLRAMGVPDWNLSVTMPKPGTFYSSFGMPPIGLGAERIAESGLKYEAASYHGTVDNAVKSRAPINGQDALDNSVRVKATSPRRVGIDYQKEEFVVFDRTMDDIYHGHVRAWKDLHPDMQRTLIKSGMADRRGNIIGRE